MGINLSAPESSDHESPFQRIRRVNSAGNEFWSSREFAEILGYTDYRNFEQVIHKARTACFNSGQRLEDHFVDVNEMVKIGSGAERNIETVYMSRYACYLVIQNADPRKKSSHSAKLTSPSKRAVRNFLMKPSKRNEDFSCAKSCAGIIRTSPMRRRTLEWSSPLITLSFKTTGT